MTGARRLPARLRRLATRPRTVVWLERAILALIVVTTVAGVLETVDGLERQYRLLFDAVDLVAVAVFSVEFAARVASRLWRSRGEPAAARLGALVTTYLLVDLLAIAPFYVGLATGGGELGASSLLRVLRLCKLARYFDVVESLGRVVRRKREDLVVSAFGTGMLWLLAASSIYVVEHGAQPEAFPSIPAALWWAGVTITTVGYGDVYPVTPLGRLLGVVVALLGIGLAAVPASILVSGLLEETGPSRRECPECGHRRDD